MDTAAALKKPSKSPQFRGPTPCDQVICSKLFAGILEGVSCSERFERDLGAHDGQQIVHDGFDDLFT